MSRSIGDKYLKPYVIPVPEVTVVARAKDGECLILASDGLWDVMSNEEVCDAARERILLWHKKIRALHRRPNEAVIPRIRAPHRRPKEAVIPRIQAPHRRPKEAVIPRIQPLKQLRSICRSLLTRRVARITSS